MTFDLQRHRQPAVTSVETHLDLGQLERVEDQIDLAARELRIDLVGVAVQADRAGLRHGPSLRPAKRVGQRVLARQCRRTDGEEPLQWCLPCLGVNPTVVDLLDPCLEDPVELLKARGRAVLELDQHLFTNRPEDAFDLPAPLRPTGRGVDQTDPEHRTRPQQLAGHERAAVINVNGVRPAACGDPGAQRADAFSTSSRAAHR